MARPSSPPADDAYRALRERILSCRLEPGEWVIEKRVAADLGFDVVVIRRALLRLGDEGLLRMLPGRGYQVAPLSLASLSELFQVWRIIAPAIIDLAMQNMTPRDRAVLLDEEPARLQAAMREGDGVALVEMSADFWMRLAELAGNARLLDIYLQLLGELRRVFALVYRDADALLALNSIMGENRRLLRRSERGREGVERFVDTAFAHVLARRRLVTWRDAADPPAWLPR